MSTQSNKMLQERKIIRQTLSNAAKSETKHSDQSNDLIKRVSQLYWDYLKNVKLVFTLKTKL